MRPVLITCGATRNPVDAIRYLSANSTGATGMWLAERLDNAHIMGSPEASFRAVHLPSVETFGSTYDLMERMERWVADNPSGVVVHAAAVGDYAAREHSGKIPSSQNEIMLWLVPTPKILDHIRGWSADAIIFSFKAAPPGTNREALVGIADKQRRRTDSRAVFANSIGQLGHDIAIVDDKGPMIYPDRKDALEALLQLVLRAQSEQ